MNRFFKKFIVFISLVAAVSTTTTLTTKTPAHADCRYFLGLTSWDCNVGSMSSETELVGNIVTIASNILTDITVIASYLVLGYVIYGGYLYMFSSGDAGKAAAGKKTLTHAFIGLGITMSAYAIFSAIRIAFIGDQSLDSCALKECVDGGTMVTNLIQWVVGMAGVVAVIFIVVGGWGYITASGDPTKLQKAKSTIMYALIGLVIVALAEVLTAFIANLVQDANDNARLDTTTIAYQTSLDNQKRRQTNDC